MQRLAGILDQPAPINPLQGRFAARIFFWANALNFAKSASCFASSLPSWRDALIRFWYFYGSRIDDAHHKYQFVAYIQEHTDFIDKLIAHIQTPAIAVRSKSFRRSRINFN